MAPMKARRNRNFTICLPYVVPDHPSDGTRVWQDGTGTLTLTGRATLGTDTG